MLGKTTNAYGNITVSIKAIELVASNYALECYGVVNLVPKNMLESIRELLFKSMSTRGVKVIAHKNRINIDVYAVLKYGVSISAVAKSLRDSIKYNVEDFTGMIVDSVNVHVKGIRI